MQQVPLKAVLMPCAYDVTLHVHGSEADARRRSMICIFTHRIHM